MSKRLNLREFQQNLINRLQAQDISMERVSTLGVQIAGSNWLVDMADIGEVLALTALTRIPFAKPWFRGVANVRGNLYGVVDMAAYGQPGTAGSSQTPSVQASGDAENRMLLVAQRHAFNVALLVDRVLGLRDAREWRQNVINGQTEYLDEQGVPWRRLDIPGLLGQAEFLQIGT